MPSEQLFPNRSHSIGKYPDVILKIYESVNEMARQQK